MLDALGPSVSRIWGEYGGDGSRGLERREPGSNMRVFGNAVGGDV